MEERIIYYLKSKTGYLKINKKDLGGPEQEKKFLNMN